MEGRGTKDDRTSRWVLLLDCRIVGGGDGGGLLGKGLITVGGAVGLSVATCHLKWADGRGQSRMIRPLDKRDERTLWL